METSKKVAQKSVVSLRMEKFHFTPTTKIVSFGTR